MISRVGEWKGNARGTRKGSCNFKERCITMKTDGENWGRLSKDSVGIVLPDFFNFNFRFPESTSLSNLFTFEKVNLNFIK